jgi:hypothetical protein
MISGKEDNARRVEPISCAGELVIHDDGDGLEVVTYADGLVWGKYKIASWDKDGIAGVIAVANACLPDDDPAKITRYKLERLEGAADPLMTKEISHFLDALRRYLPP